MAFDMAAHAVGAAGKEVERLTGSKVGRISGTCREDLFIDYRNRAFL